MILKHLFILLLFVSIHANDDDKQSNDVKIDPKIFNVEKITPGTGTINLMPIFDKTSRLVYFQGQGEEYGTKKCAHIYQLDLATKDISLFSTGLGHESRVVLDAETFRNYDPTVISTASYAFSKLAGNLNQANFNNDDLCPPSPCATKTPLLECNQPHFERYIDEGIYDFNTYGKVQYIRMHETDQDKPATSDITPCLAPKIYASGNYYLHMCAASSDNGTKVVYGTGSSDDVVLTGFEGGAFDGLQSLFQDKTDKKGHLFFHGYKFSNPPTNDEKTKIAAIKAGVIPRTGSVIFQGSADDILGPTPTAPVQLAGLANDKDYVFPFAAPNGIVVFTQYNQTKAEGTLYSFDINSANPIVQLTNSDYSTEFGALDPTNKYIVFQSNRLSPENQIFFGIYPDAEAKAPVYKKTSPASIDSKFSKYILSSLNYFDQKGVVYKSLWSPKISKSGMLMFTGGDSDDSNNYCPQIYQIDPKWNDTTVRRKLSSGIHAYDSPNFLNDDDILYAATLTKKYTKSDETRLIDLCRTRICVSGSLGYKEDLCKDVENEKPVHPDSELYISNKYGSIKQRLTKNKVYDGEATVYNSDLVVYSSYDEDRRDLNLFSFKISDKDPGASRVRIVDFFGYEGSVVFNTDGTLIAYEGYRPTDDMDIYKKRLATGFLTISSGPSFSPTFLDSERIVFLSSDSKSRSLPYLMLAGIFCSKTDCTFSNPVQLEEYMSRVYNIFFQPDLETMAFATEDGVYLSKNIKTEEMTVKRPQTVSPVKTTITPTIQPIPSVSPVSGRRTTVGEQQRHTTAGSMRIYGSGVLTAFLTAFVLLAF